MLLTFAIAPLLIPLTLQWRGVRAPYLYAGAALSWLAIAVVIALSGARSEVAGMAVTFRPQQIVAIALLMILAASGFHLALEIRFSPARARLARLMFWPLTLALAAPFIATQIAAALALTAQEALIYAVWLQFGVQLAASVSLLCALLIGAMVVSGLMWRSKQRQSGLKL